jgi:Lon protease-like protein
MSERTLPLFALSTVLIPGAPLPLHIFEQRYRRMVDDLLAGAERDLVVLLIKEGDEVLESPLPGTSGRPPVTHEVGTVAHVDHAKQLPDGRWLLACTGRDRVRLIARTQTEPYPMGAFAALPDGTTTQSADADALVARVRLAARRVFESVQAALPPGRDQDRAGLDRAIRSIPTEPSELSYFVTRALFTASNEDRQRLLEAPDPLARLSRALPLVLLEERLAAQGARRSPPGGSLN